MNAVLLADDALFLQHVAPPEHPERAERLLAVRQGLADAASAAVSASGLGLVRRGPVASVGGSEPVTGSPPGEDAYTRLMVKDATDEQLCRVHDAAYIERLGHLAGRSGYLDSDTFLSPSSVAAARRAAGSTITLVNALASGDARFGLA